MKKITLATYQTDRYYPEVVHAFREIPANHRAMIQLPGLNHLFQTAKTGSPAEYGLIDETFAPVALRTISDWIWPTICAGAAL
jgi:hypothetical protein